MRSAGAVLLLLAACAPAQSPAPAPARAAARHRALVVSFDSFNERRALHTIPADAIPAIRQLFVTGACADYAIPAWPSKTAASHASLWTGAYGDVDGIAANSQPALPRNEHTLLDLVSGYSSDQLRAEPIWISAGLAGLSVVGHHPTQAPGAPGYPAVTGTRDAAHQSALADARRVLQKSSVVVLNGYNYRYASDLAITPAVAPPHAALGWRGLGRLHSTVPPREIAWKAGDDSVFAVLYGNGKYTSVLVSASRDASHAVTADAVPVDTTSPRGRPLARYFSDPLELNVGKAGHVFLRVRLFSLAPDGSDFLLVEPSLSVVESNHPEDATAYAESIGGWVGNGAQDLLDHGALGTTVANGGDGTAELRYLETLEYVARQFIRGSEWSWKRHPDLQVDYFPLADEVDHRWYGYVSPDVPSYDPHLASVIEALRTRAWTLEDMRLAALEKLVDADSNAALFVTGDHGMRALWRTFNPNAALARAGLLAVDSAGHVDLSHTRAIAPNGLYVMVNTTDWRGGIVPPDSVAAVVALADSALRAVRGTDGQPVITRTWRVLGPDSLGRGGPVGGQLYFGTAPGYEWSHSFIGPVVSSGRISANHGYPSISPDMYTVFCARGKEIAPRRLGPARTIDVAPTVSAWLGIGPPRFAKGRNLFPAQ